ncbi:hypothetical protein EYF80_022544 [Liparis tanakae]|uniref:Uncharacterized protein n=1 Tax=Liparis tanakae TaxID=230148 RepID=A0A4Z2HMX8_9TELE|nr:hypothetical protein EYF80_022544 [Liparis tanakae]
MERSRICARKCPPRMPAGEEVNMSGLWDSHAGGRDRAISRGPLNDGGVPSLDDWPRLIDGLHADLFAVYEQLHFPALHTQRQLVPVAIKELLHAMEGPQHLAPTGARGEEVQRARFALETKAYLLPTLGVADLPQVPGFLGGVFGHLERGDDGVVGRKAAWIHIAVAEGVQLAPGSLVFKATDYRLDPLELIQSHPASSNPHHHSAAEDPYQAQLLRVSKLRRGGGRRTERGCWFVSILVGMKSGHKFVVVDVAVAVSVKYVCDRAHLQAAGGEFCRRNIEVVQNEHFTACGTYLLFICSQQPHLLPLSDQQVDPRSLLIVRQAAMEAQTLLRLRQPLQQDVNRGVKLLRLQPEERDQSATQSPVYVLPGDCRGPHST